MFQTVHAFKITDNWWVVITTAGPAADCQALLEWTDPNQASDLPLVADISPVFRSVNQLCAWIASAWLWGAIDDYVMNNHADEIVSYRMHICLSWGLRAKAMADTALKQHAEARIKDAKNRRKNH